MKKNENPIDEALQPSEVPEYKLIDIMRELKAQKNDLQMFLEQVKALGSEVVKSNEEMLARLDIQKTDFHEIKDAIVYGLANMNKPQVQQIPRTQQTLPKQQTSKIQIPQIATFPISDNAKKDLIIESRNGSPTVKFKGRVSKEDWNATNTFLRALGLKWVSDKVNKIFEWQVQ